MKFCARFSSKVKIYTGNFNSPAHPPRLCRIKVMSDLSRIARSALVGRAIPPRMDYGGMDADRGGGRNRVGCLREHLRSIAQMLTEGR